MYHLNLCCFLNFRPHRSTTYVDAVYCYRSTANPMHRWNSAMPNLYSMVNNETRNRNGILQCAIPDSVSYWLLYAYIIGSRPSDHYFVVSVCLFVCAELFSAIFDPIWIKLGHVTCPGLVYLCTLEYRVDDTVLERMLIADCNGDLLWLLDHALHTEILAILRCCILQCL